ncbi:hypothetical protein MnTg02_00290 [bacterium MnTg02]|nr:hypothetical protein MnTg02_00290 [bacterium MnTg02]
MLNDSHSDACTKRFCVPDLIGNEPHKFSFNWPVLEGVSVLDMSDIERHAAALQEMSGFCRKKSAYLAAVHYWLDIDPSVPAEERMFVAAFIGALVELANDDLEPVTYSPDVLCARAQETLDSITAAFLRHAGALN